MHSEKPLEDGLCLVASPQRNRSDGHHEQQYEESEGYNELCFGIVKISRVHGVFCHEVPARQVGHLVVLVWSEVRVSPDQVVHSLHKSSLRPRPILLDIPHLLRRVINIHWSFHHMPVFMDPIDRSILIIFYRGIYEYSIEVYCYLNHYMIRDDGGGRGGHRGGDHRGGDHRGGERGRLRKTWE